MNSVKKITRQIRKEAARQLRGFPREFKPLALAATAIVPLR